MNRSERKRATRARDAAHARLQDAEAQLAAQLEQGRALRARFVVELARDLFVRAVVLPGYRAQGVTEEEQRAGFARSTREQAGHAYAAAEIFCAELERITAEEAKQAAATPSGAAP